MKAPQSWYLKIIKTFSSSSSKSFLLIHFNFQLLLQPHTSFVFPIKTFVFANKLKLKIYWVWLKAGRAKFSDVSGSILTLTVSVEAAPQSAFADSLDPSFMLVVAIAPDTLCLTSGGFIEVGPSSVSWWCVATLQLTAVLLQSQQLPHNDAASVYEILNSL